MIAFDINCVVAISQSKGHWREMQGKRIQCAECADVDKSCDDVELKVLFFSADTADTTISGAQRCFREEHNFLP